MAEQSKKGALLRNIIYLLALATGVYHLYRAGIGIDDPIQHRIVHVSLILMLAFLVQARHKNWKSGFLLLNLLPGLIAGLIGFYLLINNVRIQSRWPMYDSFSIFDYLASIIFLILICEATRRTIGKSLIILAFLSIVYLLFGQFVPGKFYHSGYSFKEVMDYWFLGKEGLWGLMTAVSSTYIILFVTFGTFLEKSGAGDFFINLASAIAGRTSGGPAKIAVVSSGLFGMMSGSPVSDVLATGSFTIPLMKRTGYKPSFAGAVEAVASTGGALMPPIMGSAAFLMVEMTGVSYNQLIVAAALPAFLYYLAVGWNVHLEAVKTGLAGMDKEDLPKILSTLKTGVQYLIPIFLLVFLILKGFTPTRVAFYSICSTVVTSWFRKETRMGFREISGALAASMERSVMVVVTCAAVSVLVTALFLSGIGGKLSSMIIVTGSKILLVPAALTAVVTLVLGMGVPVAAAYILAAFLAAPVLVELGVSTVGAHLFVIYFAAISAITPPVCVAAFAAATLADVKPMEVGFKATKMGAIAYIIPFMFIYGPGLLCQGSFAQILINFVGSVGGVLLFGSGLQGWLLTRQTVWERMISILGGLSLIIPGLITDAFGAACMLFVCFWQYSKIRTENTMKTGMRLILDKLR